MNQETKSNKSVTWLYIASILVLAGFTWWAIRIPSSPNLSSKLPEIELTDPVRGSEKAAVTIIEYSDFQCEFCKQWHEVYQLLSVKYGSQIRLVWKDFPVESIRAKAKEAAVAARCAQQQYSFWEYHDALYQNQESLGPETYTRIAADLNLDVEEFTNCQGGLVSRNLVESSVQSGLAFGINTTPTIFIDRFLIKEAPTFEFMDNLIAGLLST
ncbi:MAG: thioredoxin domain-containing protein [bacterium]